MQVHANEIENGEKKLDATMSSKKSVQFTSYFCKETALEKLQSSLFYSDQKTRQPKKNDRADQKEAYDTDDAILSLLSPLSTARSSPQRKVASYARDRKSEEILPCCTHLL